jgi:hypothetical protein
MKCGETVIQELKALLNGKSKFKQYEAIRIYLDENNIIRADVCDDLLQLYARIHKPNGTLTIFKNNNLSEEDLLTYSKLYYNDFIIKQLKLEDPQQLSNSSSSCKKSKKRKNNSSNNNDSNNNDSNNTIIDHINTTTKSSCFFLSCGNIGDKSCLSCNTSVHNIHDNNEENYPLFCKSHYKHDISHSNHIKKKTITIKSNIVNDVVPDTTTTTTTATNNNDVSIT